MTLFHKIPIFETVKSKVIISLFETVKLSVSISPRNLYNSLKSIKEKGLHPPGNQKRNHRGFLFLAKLIDPKIIVYMYWVMISSHFCCNCHESLVSENKLLTLVSALSA